MKNAQVRVPGFIMNCDLALVWIVHGSRQAAIWVPSQHPLYTEMTTFHVIHCPRMAN